MSDLLSPFFLECFFNSIHSCWKWQTTFSNRVQSGLLPAKSYYFLQYYALDWRRLQNFCGICRGLGAFVLCLHYHLFFDRWRGFVPMSWMIQPINWNWLLPLIPLTLATVFLFLFLGFILSTPYRASCFLAVPFRFSLAELLGGLGGARSPMTACRRN